MDIHFTINRLILFLLFYCWVSTVRSCEKTLEVLRRSEKVINTLLQVLIDDPLLDWTLSAEKLEQKQKNQARGLDNTVTTNNETVLGKLY